MIALRRTLTLATLLLVGLALAAGPDALTSEDTEQNRRDLERWRHNPELYARLRQDARDYVALPPERREQLLKLDQELQQLPSATQAHLLDVLKHYADWLEGLPEVDRRSIEQAPDRAARLRRIRELRERQWLQTFPAAVRADLLQKEEKARTEAIHRLRLEEQQRRRDWQIARNFWDCFGGFNALGQIQHVQRRRPMPEGNPLPTRCTDLDSKDQVFVQEYLRPRLSPEEWEQLEKAEGEWPRFPRTLVELADRYPLALLSPRGPTHLADLPAEIRERLQRGKGPGKHFLKQWEGKWPAFGVAVSRLAPKHGYHLPNELWPSRDDDLSHAVREFVLKKLKPVLEDDEGELLQAKEGAWPDYPHTIQRLAARHYLSVPWQTLPGPRARWDGYRLSQPATTEGLPKLSQQTLRDFALVHLSPEDRAALNLAPGDPSSWQRLTQAYFEQRPADLTKLRQVDQHHPPRDRRPFPFPPPQKPGP